MTTEHAEDTEHTEERWRTLPDGARCLGACGVFPFLPDSRPPRRPGAGSPYFRATTCSKRATYSRALRVHDQSWAMPFRTSVFQAAPAPPS